MPYSGIYFLSTDDFAYFNIIFCKLKFSSNFLSNYSSQWLEILTQYNTYLCMLTRNFFLKMVYKPSSHDTKTKQMGERLPTTFYNFSDTYIWLYICLLLLLYMYYFIYFIFFVVYICFQCLVYVCVFWFPLEHWSPWLL